MCKLGLVTRDQAVPFQCRSSVGLVLALTFAVPAAQASLPDTALTPYRQGKIDGLGLVTCDQVAPSQCRIRVCPLLLLGLLVQPTAQASLAETTLTSSRRLSK